MPFETMKFRHKWRSYQKRVISAIHNHLDDKRLHIVAAPGAGKTTLGLEVFRILNKSALVLSPTRIIRDQWIDRLKDFCDTNDPMQLSWVSNSIKEPKTFTSSTYQALHTKFEKELNLEEDEGLKNSEINDFIGILKDNEIEVIILDEAHHLRSEWWKALEAITSQLPNLILVSLTATPPYDSIEHEWTRYENLCGPIDEEISIPELVKAGTLCPHQDFIWACDATADEKARIQEYDSRVYTLCDTLFQSEEFESIVLSHQWLEKENHTQEIIKEPYIAVSILSFLKEKNILDENTLMLKLDLSYEDIPGLSRHWWQILLENILFSKKFNLNQEHKLYIEQLKKQLRASELLHKKELSLERSRQVERYLSLSRSKIDACISLHNLEYKFRRDSLRQVILADYIRDEALVSNLDTGDLNLGAWPIFRNIINSSYISQDTALLSGRLSIVSFKNLEILTKHLDRTKHSVEPLENYPGFFKITAPLNKLTNAFTTMLIDGDIKTLIGTRSLLGEGWDAPVINSLVLASSVGSFMLTNQMRGRAIRVDKNDKNKVSSIWHLVALNKESYTGLSDLYNLKKRFNTFVGLSEKSSTIESGFERMNPVDYSAHLFIKINNTIMKSRYKKLGDLALRWKKALEIDENARILPSVKTHKVPNLRAHILKNSFSYLVMQMIFLILSNIFWAKSSTHDINAFSLILIALIVTLLYNLKKTITIIKIIFIYLPVDGVLKQISKALLVSLHETDFIKTSIQKIKINVVKYLDGSFYISISGCSFYESSIFSDCMAEILSPIDNPRYIISREQKYSFMTKYDYHAVPLRFAVRKNTATVFFNNWSKYVSPSKLIYTKSSVGRELLLQAKMKSFSSNFEDEVKRMDRWY